MSAVAPVAKEGTSIPAVPVAMSSFATFHEAGTRLLARSSAHGQFSTLRAIEAAVRS